jgi:hypothetical protein
MKKLLMWVKKNEGKLIQVAICLIVTVLVLGFGILGVKKIVDEIDTLCLKTNETIQTRYGKVNCLDWNSKNMTVYSYVFC